ncbi:helix-turn-helix domain-containing protein [Streptomyces sp. NPDC002851]
MTSGNFGAAFRRIREIAGLRQDDMARLTGLSQSFLSSLESGTRRLVNIDKIQPVLENLDVPAHALPALFSRTPPTVQPRPHPMSEPAPLAEDMWEEPLDIAERLNRTTSSNTDPAALDLLHQQVTQIVDSYESAGPHQLAPKTIKLRAVLQDFLDGRQPPRQREALFKLAAQVSGLLGYMAVNAGREALAEAYCTESHQLAHEIHSQELLMWTFGTRSLGAYYAGNYRQALQWADAGIAVNPSHTQAIRLLANGRARALGKLKDRAGAQRAIGAAEDLSNRHTVPDGLTPCIAFAPYSLSRTLANAATTHVALGNTTQVIDYAGQIDELVEQSDSAWSRALVRLDVATALLTGPRPDVEHAMVLGRQVLETGGGPPIRSVVQRAGELHAHAARWNELPAVRDYEEALRTWRAVPLTRQVTESAKIAGPSEQTRRAAGAPDRHGERIPYRAASEPR